MRSRLRRQDIHSSSLNPFSFSPVASSCLIRMMLACEACLLPTTMYWFLFPVPRMPVPAAATVLSSDVESRFLAWQRLSQTGRYSPRESHYVEQSNGSPDLFNVKHGFVNPIHKWGVKEWLPVSLHSADWLPGEKRWAVLECVKICSKRQKCGNPLSKRRASTFSWNRNPAGEGLV